MSHSRYNRQNKLLGTIITLAVILVALLAVAFWVTREQGEPPLISSQPETEESTQISTEASSEATEPEPSSEPTDPPIVKISSATIAATGDMLMHLPVINKYHTDGVYNFDGIFQYFRDYVQDADYAAGNLETTLCGLDNGYKYHGYPAFNCPDEIIDGMKNAGFDLVLTANNHTYDTRKVGMLRTLDIITDRNLDYLGTSYTSDAPNYIIREINDISVGMLCYTYETGNTNEGCISLNGIPLTLEASGLVNAFNYYQLDSFYAEMEANLEAMEAQGVEATVLFIHWGEEYRLTPTATQKAMAQKLCDLGIDVIIGGHPHVIEPVELLTSTADEDHKTVCLYSMGNAVSNQFRQNMDMKTGHTEDGVLFSVTFSKYSDGTVILETAKLLPTWIDSDYHILPLDDSIEDWQTQFNVSDSVLAKMKVSYDRTMAIVGVGMAQVDTYLKENTAKVEAQLNVMQ